MIVILSGCDGTGKSSCYDMLRKSIDANFIKESYTDNLIHKIHRTDFVLSKLDDQDITIYDRATILDDFVYDPVIIKRESKLISAHSKKYYSDILNRCVIIYLDCDIDCLKDRLTYRGDHYITINDLQEIKNSYERVFNDFNLKPHRIDVTDLSQDDVYIEVRKVLGV